MPQIIRTRVSRDPLNARAYRTQRPESPEDLWQPLYDRVNTATTTTELSFFTVPKGQTATLIRNGTSSATVTKTYRDTNLEQAGVVPTKLFKFIGISLAFCHLTPGTATNAKDRDIIRDNGYLQFRIVDTDILYLPLVNIPDLNPLVVGSTTANNTTIIGAAGGGGNAAMYKFPIPITLQPYENFTVKITFDAANSSLTYAVDVYCVLQGYMRRPG